MRLKPALDSAIARLERAGTGSPRLNAEALLMFTLGCDRAYLFAHAEQELSTDELHRYQAAVVERSRGKPAQYITGHQEFWGLDLVVSPAVLIPRPETEHVVETVLGLVRSAGVPPAVAAASCRRSLRLVDVGTGSGCIALALAKELPAAEIVAVDISAAALEMARANAARLEFEQRVRFLESDLLAALLPAASSESNTSRSGSENGFFDFVVSNPPYVSESEPEKAQREVREFEPRVAVFAGENGLEVYRRLIPQAHAALRPGGWLVVEIGFSMEAAVRTLLVEPDWPEVRTTHDLQGIPRVVAARRE